MAGWLAGKGGILRTFSAMLVANLACLVIGSTWLTVVLAMPVAKAFAVGAEALAERTGIDCRAL